MYFILAITIFLFFLLLLPKIISISFDAIDLEAAKALDLFLTLGTLALVTLIAINIYNYKLKKLPKKIFKK